MRAPCAWPKERRLRRAAEFARVYAEGRKVHGRYLVCFALSGQVGEARVGLTVGKKVGNAVARNRVRRRLREALRQRSATLPAGYEFAVVARHPAAAVDRDALAQDFERCLARLTRESAP